MDYGQGKGSRILFLGKGISIKLNLCKFEGPVFLEGSLKMGKPMIFPSGVWILSYNLEALGVVHYINTPRAAVYYALRLSQMLYYWSNLTWRSQIYSETRA